MSINANLLELGPANVYYDENGDGVPELFLGAMGDELAVTMATEASPLTAAQTGTVPQAKVVTGGSFKVTIPFKEIALRNFQRAFPNATYTSGVGGERVDFLPRVGLNLRTIAKKMKIVKLLGGTESTDPNDIMIIPLAAPADTEVVIPFSPTEQRMITATFEAWPQSVAVPPFGFVANRWAFMGDEFTS